MGAGGQDALGGPSPVTGMSAHPVAAGAGSPSPVEGRAAQPRGLLQAGVRVSLSGGIGMDGSGDRVPGVEHPPASPHVGLSLLRRAEVILGNILKKKGWRYWTAGRCSPPPANERDPWE